MGKTVLGILAHVDAGKTTLSEALLYRSGVLRNPGRVDNQDAFLDTYDLEKKRGITIFSKLARFPAGGQEIILLDTPGHVDFSTEMERTLQVLDYAVLLVSGSDGVQGHTRTLWRLLRQYRIPTLIFVNKMDQEGAVKEELLAQLEESFGEECIDFTPFPGLLPRQDGSLKAADPSADPAQMYDRIAMSDEAAMEEYIEQEKISLPGIRRLVKERKIFPCFFGSALKLEGVDELICGLGGLLEAPMYPDSFGARVYKISRDETGKRLTFLKVTGGSLKVKSLLGEEKINEIRLYNGAKYTSAEEAQAGEIAALTGPALTRAGMGFGGGRGEMLPLLEPVLTSRLILPDGVDALRVLPMLRELEEEDPQLHILWSKESREISMQLMGEIQTQVLVQLIRERYGLDVSFGDEQILYKETIESPVEGIGHFEPLRHYAEVHLRLEPAPQGSGLSFASECAVNDLDRNWQRLILTHLAEKEHRGVLTGSPITDMRIVLIAGRAHTKHTEGGDFRQATYRAVRQGLMKARSVILEPWFEYRMEMDPSRIGRAMADVERMKGSFDPPETEGGYAVLKGRAPVALMRGYQQEFLSYTGGEGRLSLSLAGYYPCHDPAAVWEDKAYQPESDLENTPDSVFCSHGAGFIVPWYAVERYMHLPGAGLPDYSGMTGQDFEWYETAGTDSGGYASLEDGNLYSESTARDVKKAAVKRRSRDDGYAGEDELRAIFERTYGAAKPRGTLPENVARVKAPAEYIWKEKPKKKKKEEFLLVDGYNIIFAWEDLRALASHDLPAARDTLLDRISDYQGYTGVHVIVVFDAWKVQGFQGESLKWHNISVVYTKEAETADQYIEKTAHVMAKSCKVVVATSDGTEQVIIRSEGCLLLSASDLQDEMRRVKQESMEEREPERLSAGTYLGEMMPDLSEE